MPRRVPRNTGTWGSWVWGRGLSEEANTVLDLETGGPGPLPWLAGAMLQAPWPQPGAPLQGGQGSWEGAALSPVLQGSLATSFLVSRRMVTHGSEGCPWSAVTLQRRHWSDPRGPSETLPLPLGLLRSLRAGGQMEQRPPLC